MPEPQQRRRGQRPVADPRSRIGARARLQGRPAAVDEDVAEGGAQRPGDVRDLGRAVDADPVERARASAPRRGLLAAERRASAGNGRRRDRQRRRRSVRCSPGREAQVVAQHGVGEAVRRRRCASAPRSSQAAARPRSQSPTGPAASRLEANAARRDCIGRRRSAPLTQRAPPSHFRVSIGLAPPRMGEELRRRVRLERPPGERERDAACLLAKVAHACSERPPARARACRRRRPRCRAPRSPTRQCTGRHRQVAVAQRVLMRASAQLASPPVDDEKRLERADARHRLDHAVLAQQRSDASAVDAEHGPVRLLADVGARVAARGATAWRAAAKNAFASIGGRAELGERDRAAPRLVDAHAHEARFAHRASQCCCSVAARALDAAHGRASARRRRTTRTS